ncbi:MAG TPA: RT0821/Lpp0805 family surface protein [Candidatus Methylomirabilis sp.]|nr:RT0821/Lpp0805 family surface protein [Candidatus Methylomirabilis sp.]
MRGRILKGVAVGTLVVVALTGCSTIEANPKTTIGAVGGGTLGGLIAAAAGGSPAAIAASVIGGILVGGLVGNLLDERDKKMAAEAQQKALETAPAGRSVAWRNPDSGHSGTVTPERTYQKANGQYCREFQTNVKIGDKSEKAHGTACRQPDGSWKIVS